ncbi:hypothetical protein Q7C36_000896 [Tachysurus vachellii]|uniref:Uncharacterized protein n=1 Tax=Tachysurus vachellii TaxID=175792 RepID=A0AA88P316_TACVA|nr:hypothetical protein Q7C36_000896 [Tachysurus vachellii]
MTDKIGPEESEKLMIRRTVFPHLGTIDPSQTESVGVSEAPPDKTITTSFNFAVILPTEIMLDRQNGTAVVRSTNISKCS